MRMVSRNCATVVKTRPLFLLVSNMKKFKGYLNPSLYRLIETNFTAKLAINQNLSPKFKQ